MTASELKDCERKMSAMKWTRVWLILATLACPLAGAFSGVVAAEEAKADEKKEEAKKITYDEHVLPIFRQRCGSCHNGNDQKGGLAVDTFTALMQGGGSGEVVEAGDADASYLFMVINHDSEPFMPPSQPKMPEAELAVIREWINLGALENKGSKAVVKKKSDLAKIEISNERPADAPVLPQNLPLTPVLLTPSANSVTALANSPWASLAAVAGFNQVLLYSTETGLLTGVLPFPEGTPYILKFSRNGQLLLAGGGIGGASGKVVVFDVKTGNRVAELGNEYDAVLAADISADHTQVVLSGPKRMIRVYSVQTEELMYEIKKHTDWVLAAEFSPDGVLLATADRSNGMFLWEAVTGNEYLSIKGHTGAITDVSWRPDSNLVASCSEDGTIRLWELNDGKEVKRWNAHGGGVSALEYTRNANIVSIGRDRSVKLWNGEGQAQKTYGGLQDLGLAVAFDSELNRVLGGDWAGEVRVWDADSTNHLFSVANNPAGLNEQLTVTQKKLEQAVAQRTSADNQVKALQQQIDGRKQVLEAARKQLTDTETQFKASQTEQAGVEKSLADKKLQMDQLKQAGDQLQAELKKAQQQQIAAQQAVQQAEATLKQAQAAAQMSQQDLASLQKQLQELQSQEGAEAEAVQKLQDQTATATQTVTTQQAAAQTAEKTLAEARASVTAADQQIAALQGQVKPHEMSVEQAAAEFKTLEAKRAQVSEQQKNLTAQREKIAKSIAEMEPKVAATEDEKKKLNELTTQRGSAEKLAGMLEQHVQQIQQQLAGAQQAANN